MPLQIHLTMPSVGENMEQWEHSYTASECTMAQENGLALSTKF